MIKISRTALLKALGFVGVASPRNATIPICSMVKIEIDNKARLTCTSQDLTAITSVPLISGEKADFCVSTSDLASSLKVSSGDEVEITLDDARAHIKCGKNKFKLATVGTKRFPADPEFGEAVRFDIKSAVLQNALALSAYAASTEYAIKPSLCVVNLDNNGIFRAWASNQLVVSFVLGQEAVCEKAFNATIPSNAVRAFQMFTEQHPDIAVTIERYHIALESGGSKLIARQGAHKSPVLDQLRSTNEDHAFTFLVEDLLAVTAAGQSLGDLATDAMGRFVKFRLSRISESEMRLTSAGQDAEFEGTFPAVVHQDFEPFILNGIELRKFLGAVPKTAQINTRVSRQAIHGFVKIGEFDLEFIQSTLRF